MSLLLASQAGGEVVQDYSLSQLLLKPWPVSRVRIGQLYYQQDQPTPGEFEEYTLSPVQVKPWIARALTPRLAQYYYYSQPDSLEPAQEEGFNPNLQVIVWNAWHTPSHAANHYYFSQVDDSGISQPVHADAPSISLIVWSVPRGPLTAASLYYLATDPLPSDGTKRIPGKIDMTYEPSWTTLTF